MISIVKADGRAEYEYLANVREREGDKDRDVSGIVSDILENVRKNGDKAVREYTIIWKSIKLTKKIIMTMMI